MKSKKMWDLLNLAAEYHGADLSDNLMAMYVSELRMFSEEQVGEAWQNYRNFPTNIKMPTPAQLKSHMKDGRPSANEAWAMIPWNEEDSVVWSDEMRYAFATAQPLVSEGQKTNAFFAFKEVYEKKVMENRLIGKEPVWSMSPGLSKSGRDAALKEALEKNRITNRQAISIEPRYQIEEIITQQLESESFKKDSKEKMKAKSYLVKDLIAAINSGDEIEIEKLKRRSKELFNEL